MKRTRFDKVEIFLGQYYKVRFELFKYLCPEEERKYIYNLNKEDYENCQEIG